MRRQKLADGNAVSALGYGFRQALKSPAVLSLFAAPLVGMGIGALSQRRQATQDAAAKANAYKEMLDLHPHFRQRDQREIGRIYNSLHNASPSMARDPLVAGAWLDNVLENKVPGTNSHQALLNAVRDLTGVQKNISDVQRNNDALRSQAPARAEAWVRDFGSAVDKSQTAGLDARIKREEARLQKEEDTLHEVKRKWMADKEEDRTKWQATRMKEIESLENRARQLGDVEDTHKHISHLGKLQARIGQGKPVGIVSHRYKTSALREMLRALKV